MALRRVNRTMIAAFSNRNNPARTTIKETASAAELSAKQEVEADTMRSQSLTQRINDIVWRTHEVVVGICTKVAELPRPAIALMAIAGSTVCSWRTIVPYSALTVHFIPII